MSARFTTEHRERFLTLLEAGWTAEAAAAAVPVSRQTVNTWAARGRATNARTDHREFAERYDAAKLGPDEQPLTEAETLKLVERAARKGSVGALKMMQEHHLKQRLKRAALGLASDDPFAALDAEQDPFSADPADELNKSGGQR